MIPLRLILLNKPKICRFQGHYINRWIEENSIHGQCHDLAQQNRNFFDFSNSNKKREYNGRQLVGHSMDEMFQVVSDVEKYYQFVPWCKQSTILKKEPEYLKAKLMVGFPPLNESYTSNVTLIKPHLVKAVCTDGKLFNYMLTLWRFSPGLKSKQRSCVVDFHITFEFRSSLHSHFSNLFFDQVARQMEGAFIKEVGKRYGPASLPPKNLLVSNDNLHS